MPVTAGSPIVAEDFMGQVDENTADIAALQGDLAAVDTRVVNLESHNPTWRVRRSAPKTINVDTDTDYDFDIEDWDNGPSHSGGGAEFVIPLAGVYRFSYSGYWQADTAGYRMVKLYVNGSEVYADHAEGDADVGPPMGATWPLLFLDATDTVKLVAYYNAAGGTPATLTLQLDFTGEYVMSGVT